MGAGQAEANAILRDATVAEPGCEPVPRLPLSAGGSLRIVSSYRHLGTMIGPRRSCVSMEVASRISAANAAAAALAKPFFGKQTLRVAARTQVATACVQSRLLYMAGT